MTEPTPERLAILDDTASRVRIVRAVPGSGKTWLVAEVIRRELTRPGRDGRGIAAISFTRVGGDEIRLAVGRDLEHPNFVGTIDAFLFRYVLRPFLSKVFSSLPIPRLMPAEWQPDKWTRGHGGYSWDIVCNSNGVARVYNWFNIMIVAAGSPPQMATMQFGRLCLIPSEDAEQVWGEKKKLWKQRGILTHSDAAFLASVLLEHTTHGQAIRSALVGRFGTFVVDELQDTGHFLGKCVRLLAQESSTRAILVGDPDQAIYEFNGANPALFKDFGNISGSREHVISTTRRLSSSVVRIAQHLKEAPGAILSAESRVSRCTLVPYGPTGMAECVGAIARAASSSEQFRTIKIVARANSVVDALRNRSVAEVPKLGCPATAHLQRAVVAFRNGKNSKALSMATAAISVAAFGTEDKPASELSGAGVDLVAWRRTAVAVLLRCEKLPSSGTCFDWQKAALSILHDAMPSLALQAANVAKRLSVTKRRGYDLAVEEVCGPVSSNCDAVKLPTVTIHAVKGETHDLTVLVIPEGRVSRCPSTRWWPATDEEQEERRIAYVAATRTRGDFVMVLPQAVLARLRRDRAQFVDEFSVMDSDAFTAAMYSA